MTTIKTKINSEQKREGEVEVEEKSVSIFWPEWGNGKERERRANFEDFATVGNITEMAEMRA